MRKECVQCGYCCTVGPCFHGASKEHELGGPCGYLTDDMKCAIYDKILLLEKDDEYPMFGCGCSSSMFNEMREEKIRSMRDGVTDKD